MNVYILSLKTNELDWYTEGVYSSEQNALEMLTGEPEDYERMSDTEQYFETSTGKWVIEEWVVK